MRSFLKTYPLYADELADVWLWADFPSREDLSGKDTGIDLVARTKAGDYWAVQCKCYKQDSRIESKHSKNIAKSYVGRINYAHG
jgi:predicted helicase